MFNIYLLLEGPRKTLQIALYSFSKRSFDDPNEQTDNLQFVEFPPAIVNVWGDVDIVNKNRRI